MPTWPQPLAHAVATIALVALAACAAPRPHGLASAPARATHEGAAAFPVSRLIPASAAYVVMSARADQAVRVVREALDTFVAAGAFYASERLDREMRSAWGASILSLEDLAAAGVALDRNVAFFGTPPELTFAIPVNHVAKVEALVRRMLQDWTPGSIESRGIAATRMTRHGTSITWLVVEGWLVVHVSPHTGRMSDDDDAPALGTWFGAWLDAREAGATFDGSDAFAWAWRAAGSRRDALAVLETDAMSAALRRDDECGARDRQLARAVPRLAMAAHLAPGVVDVRVGFQLVELAVAALRRIVAPPPPPAFVALRDGAAAFMSLGLDLEAFGLGAREVRARGCLWTELVAEFDLDELTEPLTGLTALHVAILGGGVAAGDVELEAVAAATIVDADAFERVLRELPPPVRIEEGGVVQRRYAVPGLTAPLAIAIVQGGHGVRAAVGPARLGSLLAEATPSPTPSPPRDGGTLEVAAAAIEPARLTTLLDELARHGGSDARFLVRMLKSFTRLEARALLATDAFYLEGMATLAGGIK